MSVLRVLGLFRRERLPMGEDCTMGDGTLSGIAGTLVGAVSHPVHRAEGRLSVGAWRQVFEEPAGLPRAGDHVLRAEGRVYRRKRRRRGLPEGHGHRRRIRPGRAVGRAILLSRLLGLWRHAGTAYYHLRGVLERRSVADDRIEIRAGGRPSVRE